MKTRERIKQSRRAVSFTERLALAYDAVTPELDGFYGWSKTPCTVKELGIRFANMLARRDSGTLRRIADALDAWSPNPDRLRIGLLLAHWRLTGGSSKQSVSMRALLAAIKAQRITVEENTPRRIRTLCKELQIPIKGRSGRPKK